tara:strand:+ start:1196 stop:1519 length:324 start_codon:yes stop_codon:yes gene_type:complete
MAFKMRGFSGFKQTDGKKILAKYKEKKPGGRDPYEIPTGVGSNTTSGIRRDSLHRTRQYNKIGLDVNPSHLNPDGSIKTAHFDSYAKKVDKIAENKFIKPLKNPGDR